MSYNKENFVRIKSEFSQKYLKARERAMARQNELHQKIPRVLEIDRILSRTGIEIMGAIALGGQVDERVSALRVRNEKLIAERGAILRLSGYPEDYSDVKYECEKCGDTGYVETHMCECMKRALIIAGYESSGLGALIRSKSFENFSLDFYKTGNGNVEKMTRFRDNLKGFADKFNSDTYMNFILIGGTGLGKTHLSTAVAKKIIDNGYDVLYVTAVEMVSDFSSVRFGDGSRVKRDVGRYFDTELLIIDDLGTEVVNQFTMACLYDVINSRINMGKSTIINTNLSLKEIETRYSERIFSRLVGEYKYYDFSGDDIRKQKIHMSK